MGLPELEALEAEVRACHACRLSAGRHQAVPGEGAAPAPLLVVGEGPGAREDELGRPFVGRSGQLLDALLADETGLDRSGLYIANTVKCRPRAIARRGRTRSRRAGASLRARSTWSIRS